MPVVTHNEKEPAERSVGAPSILLATDTERFGNSLHNALREQGFDVHFAGTYAALDGQLHRGQPFDFILLEVTGDDAVEPAVQTALRVKRSHPDQFVGYIADSSLETSGLAGDGVFPRSMSKLPAALRSFFAAENGGSGIPDRR
jgi:PleD family two-component response regulator